MPYTSLPQTPSPDILTGRALAGDDYSREQLAKWYSQEENAFANMDASEGMTGTDPWYEYMRHLNEQMSEPLLRARWPADKPLKVMMLGPGDGTDAVFMRKLFPNTEFFFVEASPDFQKTLGERYGAGSVIAPQIDGTIKLPEDSVDLVMAFSVLHHIANVSFVVQEVGRILRPGGLFITREPCSSMGDWSKPRSSTPNERGISAKLMVQIAQSAGLRNLTGQRPVPVLFAPLNLILKRFSKFITLSKTSVRRYDRLLSSMVAGNDWYWRDRWWKKLGPSAYFYVFEKSKT